MNFTGYDDAMLTALYADLLIEQAALHKRSHEVNANLAGVREERFKRSQPVDVEGD